MKKVHLTASVIVRCLNKATTIRATLESIRRQSVPAEVVVVDSGSIDDTVEIAHEYADRLVRIHPEEFSYGGALNLGAAHASGEIHFALSAHCSVPSDWIERSLAHYADPLVGGTNGALFDNAHRKLTEPWTPSLEDLTSVPWWGFSNHASSWRGSLIAEFPFREDLPACEDKEWSWRVVGDDRAIVFDPALFVSGGHRRQDGLRALYQRAHKEGMALSLLGKPTELSLRKALHDWWTDFPYESRYPRVVRRLSPFRAAEHLGALAGARAGQRT